MGTTRNMTLGQFMKEISGLKPPRLTRDEPFEPLSISMQADSINVILSASPYIALRSGNTSVTLSHVQTVKPSVKHGQKSYKVICGDYTTSNDPQPVEYRLTFPD